MLRSISTKEKFPRTENFPKISLLKVENFQLQNFFPTKNLCRPITFYKIFFLRKIFLSENGPLDLRRFSTRRNFSTESKFRHIHLCFMSSRAELIVKRQREISFRSKNSASWNQAFRALNGHQNPFGKSVCHWMYSWKKTSQSLSTCY